MIPEHRYPPTLRNVLNELDKREQKKRWSIRYVRSLWSLTYREHRKVRSEMIDRIGTPPSVGSPRGGPSSTT